MDAKAAIAWQLSWTLNIKEGEKKKWNHTNVPLKSQKAEKEKKTKIGAKNEGHK